MAIRIIGKVYYMVGYPKSMPMNQSFKFESPRCECDPLDESKWTKVEMPGYRTVFTCEMCKATWETINPPNIQHGRTYYF